MSFANYPIIAGLSGLQVNGLTLSKTAPLTLQLATGDVTHTVTGLASALGVAQSHVFTPDATYPTQVNMNLVDNGTTVDLWVDQYVDDGKKTQADPPEGYRSVLSLAWFKLAANETDLANTIINRRVYQ